MRLADGSHLTYCSNIHPGESWTEVRANLERHVTRVRDAVAPDAAFGIGLRLSARAAAELSDPAAFEAFTAFLARERMYVFTVNGFPYGTFHGTRVKEHVYLPDWRDRERLRYTNRLAVLLSRLLPDGVDGSISTVPGAYKAALRDAGDPPRMADNIVRHVAHLVDIERRTGKHIALALEPEPCCLLETVEESIDFFGRYLHDDASAAQLGALTGLDRQAAAIALRRHLGLCLDLCHAAVEFEDPSRCVQALREAGIAIPKMQISSGLRIPALTGDALTALRAYQDTVYLHQVVEKSACGLRRFDDLPDAFASLEARPGDSLRQTEWRVHFHVPLFVDALERFSSTQFFIREMLAAHRLASLSAHLEVETYTWDVLPPALRTQAVEDAVARELEWVLSELCAAGTAHAGAGA
ncbi:MAG: metabolite traffic protein EboE [Burkholderiales bacterium]|nr:metabolite traffic protein EboE [Burkholderiales bacterium]